MAHDNITSPLHGITNSGSNHGAGSGGVNTPLVGSLNNTGLACAVSVSPAGSSSGGNGSLQVGPTNGTTQQPTTMKICCFPLSLFSLMCLVVQNCSAVLLMRITKTRENATPYSVPSVVISTELLKLAVVVPLMVWQQGVRASINDVFWRDSVRLAVPAACYALQNNLLFVALANLEATMFQVTYQLKLLITALFMVLMLGQQISRLKWCALALVFLGVVLTQIKTSSVAKADGTAESLSKGLAAVITCSVSSAFASVYFEKVLKTSSSLFVRNTQLSLWSIVFVIPAYIHEGRPWEDFFVGYDFLVTYLVFNQAAGGILVALVIKYADNIMKGFATAIAIIVSGIVSYVWLDFQPTLPFLCGAALVLTSVTLYSLPDKPPAIAPTQRTH